MTVNLTVTEGSDPRRAKPLRRAVLDGIGLLIPQVNMAEPTVIGTNKGWDRFVRVKFGLSAPVGLRLCQH